MAIYGNQKSSSENLLGKNQPKAISFYGVSKVHRRIIY